MLIHMDDFHENKNVEEDLIESGASEEFTQF